MVSKAQLNISFAGELDYQALRNSDLSNLWGYTDELGNEYALVGVNGDGNDQPGGISVVDISDPAAPQEVFFFPGPASIWREVKVWNDHAYVTTEAMSGGVTIVDLSPLPQSTDLPAVLWNAPDWETSHSLFIDENGRLYIHGADRGNGGVIMYDLTQDPMVPVEVGSFDNWYCHDSFARGDTLYAAHIYDGFFSIVDVSDPSSPVLLGTQNTPNDFTHNVWLDDSGSFLFTTDERTNSYVGAYDVADPTDIIPVDQLRSDGGSGAIPHNTYWLNDYVVTSYYTFGVTIYDATRPDNLVEVGHYDTSPFNGDGFNGAWGVYPFFASQRLIISDIEEGLVILDPTYVRACWLEGTVTDAITGNGVNGAALVLVGTGISEASGITGAYATGYHTGGTYTVQVSAPGYVTATITGVALVNGELTELDVALEPQQSFAMSGAVVDAFNSEGVPGAQVRFSNEDLLFSGVANGSGDYTLPSVFNDTYEVAAAQWGWLPTCASDIAIDPSVVPYTISLERGYADDMSFDLGWTVTGTATMGSWERAVPGGMTLNGQVSNPASDATGDCGDAAYVTGPLAGVSAGDFDLDGGYTELRSPIFDVSGMSQPAVRYHRWFVNGGGSGSPNDRLVISIGNGASTAVVETVENSVSAWVPRSFNILDHVSATDQMTFIAYAVDDAPGHVVEAGIDRFEVVDLATVGLPEDVDAAAFALWPNPSSGQVNLLMPAQGRFDVDVLDAAGRLVLQEAHLQDGTSPLTLQLGTGAYLVRVTSGEGVRSSRSILVVP